MNYQQVYNYIQNDIGRLLHPAQRSVMLYEIENFRAQLLSQLNGDVSGWIHGVCNTFGTTFHAINIPSREKPLPLVRQVIMWGLQVQVVPNALTLEAIGRLLPEASRDGDGLNHATVLHSKRAVKNLLDTDETLREKITPLLNAFGWQCEYLPKSRCFHMYRMRAQDVLNLEDAA